MTHKSSALIITVDSPENGEIGRLTEEFVHIVHHPGVKLGHVHDLGELRVVLQCQRSFTHTGVSLENANKTSGMAGVTFDAY